MLSTLLSLVLLAPPTGFTASVERLKLKKLPGAVPTVEVDALGSRLVVRNAALVGALESQTCPVLIPGEKSFTLTCQTRRFWAGLVDDEKGGLALDLRTLHGLPWEGDAVVPMESWPISALGINDECPGRLEATRAECLFAEGQVAEAEELFKKARSGPDANFAYLRLGDLAMRRGDVEGAVHLYAFVPQVGALGRVAKARLCDLTGSCLAEKDSDALGDVFGVPEPLKRELQLAYWRREIYVGREARIMKGFTAALGAGRSGCELAAALCQKVLLLGLASTDDAAKAEALDGWLFPVIRSGPYELDLALAAAKAADDLGAPGFAATVLASVTSRMDPAVRGAHLLRVVQLYEQGNDPVRAGVILEYAESSLAPKTLASAPWKAAHRRLHPERVVAKPTVEPPRTKRTLTVSELEAEVGLAAELARATSLRSRAKEP